jgi:hypothetical protein
VIGKAISTTGQDPAALTELAFERVKDLMPVYTETGGRKVLRKQLTHLF